MNKKIIGMSIAMLFAATGAAAQTSVTMYGTVDAGVAYRNGADAAGKTLTLESGQQSYSRLGFRGVEDLGGGMKAHFVLEQGILIDTGNSGYDTLGSGLLSESGTFSSQAYVGVSSHYGTLKLGRQFTPLYEAYWAIDPFMNGFAANINNFFGTNAFNVSNHQRMSNAVIYNTPDSAHMMGFKGALAYGFGEQAGSTASQSQVGVSIGYDNGPLTLVYAFHRANQDPFDSFKTHFIGGKYNFGMLSVHGAFDNNKQGDTFRTQDYMLGVTFPWGMHSFFADFTHKKNKELDSANANQFGIGYTYALSKRTNVYSAYTHLKNGANSFINTDTAGKNVNTFQIGMRHMF